MRENADPGLLTQALVKGEPIEVRAGRILDVAHHAAPSEAAHHDTVVFFAHGGGGNKNQWRYQWQAVVEAGYSAVAWDFLGHGASPRPAVGGADSPYHGEQTLLDYLAILERYKGARNVLVGHSMGTGSTLRLLQQLAALGRLEEVAAALLLGTQLTRPPRGGVLEWPTWIVSLLKPFFARRFRRLAWHPLADPLLVAFEERTAARNTMAIMQAVMRDALWAEADRLADLALPIVLVSGDSDALTPPAGARALAEALTFGTFIELPDCGHQIMLEKPATVNRVLGDVLAFEPRARGDAGLTAAQ
jgi:pimeloyl-ACP methyl ester carboxylesterase